MVGYKKRGENCSTPHGGDNSIYYGDGKNTRIATDVYVGTAGPVTGNHHRSSYYTLSCGRDEDSSRYFREYM